MGTPQTPDVEMVYHAAGFCPICEKKTEFKAWGTSFRDHLICHWCHSIPRQRAIALMLNETAPKWRRCVIHESSPSENKLSAKLQRHAKRYVATQFHPAHPPGQTINGFRNENLERQTFANASFDLVITQDVMEHVNEPELCFREIHRTLKPGGLYLFTTPTFAERTHTMRRALYKPDGTIEHYADPEYHGSPIDPAGSLVTFHYGYDLPDLIRQWAPFDVRVARFNDAWHGLIGDFTEVYVCRRR